MSKAAQRKRAQGLIEAYRQRLAAIKQAGGLRLGESGTDQQQRIKRVLADPVAFAEEYFPHYCQAKSADFHAQAARRILRGKDIRIVLRWARAHAKSVWADVIIPIWLWARGEPMYLVIIGSSFDKAKTLLSDVQAEFEANERLLYDFGEQQMAGTWQDGHFATRGGFVGHALGMGQSTRGIRQRALRPTYIVLDDCETRQLCKNPKRLGEMVQWVETDVLGTMDGPLQRLVIANNRFAPDMIQVRLLEKHTDWVLNEVKAYDKATYAPAWPAKYTADYWRAKEADGKLAAHAEYLNEPHVEGTIFTDELFNYGTPPRIDRFKKLVAHWDVAYAGTATADYNAVRVWGLDADNRYWLLATYCKQSKMRGAIDWMIAYDRALPASVVVHWQYESQFWNEELQRTLDEACRDAGHQLRISRAELSKAHKYDRILSLHPYYQNGRVWYSEKLKGLGDHEVGLAQLKGIEPGYSGHDDAPDADERAISNLSYEAHVASYHPPVFGARPRPRNLY
jgi:phage terminase large subunit-like protein